MSPQEYIAYVARVSNPSNQNNHDTSEKLLQYCFKNKHFSVFEMFDLTFEIEITRDIGRQILRHRSFSFQEFSQRYAKPTDLGFEYREARLQDKKNRQNSVETANEYLDDIWIYHQTEVIEKSLDAYNWAIENGIAKEQARAVLPEGLTLSKIYMKGSLRSFIHYCQVRMDKSTQKEHRLVAEEIWKNIVEIFPFLNNQ